MSGDFGIKKTTEWVLGIVSIALILIVVLIIFGNLSGNLGFAALSSGANDTNAVINNVTSGTGKLVSNFPTIMLFLGIGLLLFVLVGVLAYVIRAMSGVGKSTGNFN